MFGRGRNEVNPQWDNPANYKGKYPPDWDSRRKLVYQRDDYQCQYCGRRSGPYAGDGGAVLHAHHRHPLGRGGSNHLDNLETVCQYCHDQVHGHPTGERYHARNVTRVLRALGKALRVLFRILR